MGRAGDLRELVTIEQSTTSVQAAGNRTEVWTTFAEVWASVNQVVSSQESLSNKMVKAVFDYRIVIRRLPGVSPRMRVKLVDGFDSNSIRYFNIHTVLRVDSQRMYDALMCMERVA